MKKNRNKLICITIAIFLLLLAGYFLSQYSSTLKHILSEKKAESSQSTEEADAADENEAEESKTDLDTSSYPFEIIFYDVGQADCTIIRCNDEWMVVDMGTHDSSSEIVGYLNSVRGVKEIEAVIATHDHADHIGGVGGVFNPFFEINHVYCSMTDSEEEAFPVFKRMVAQKSLQIEVPAVGDTFTLGDAQVAFLGPSDALQGNPNSNNRSLVIKVTYKDVSLLITGDAEQDELGDLVSSGQDLSAQILKVGHHGASNGITDSFAALVHPKIAVISCGKDNDYGHPHKSTLATLGVYMVDLYRTDLQGTITVVSDGKDIEVQTEREADLIDLWTKGKYDPE